MGDRGNGPRLPWLGTFRAGWTAYSLALFTVALATAVSLLLSAYLRDVSVLMIYVFCIAVLAAHVDRGPRILAAGLGVAAFDFFFLPASDWFQRFDLNYVVTLTVMLLLVLAIGDSASRLRAQARDLSARQKEIEILEVLDRALADANRPADIARIAVDRSLVFLGFDAAAAVVLVDHGVALRLVYARDVAPPVVTLLERGFAVDASVAGQAVRERRVVVVDVVNYPDGAGPGLASAVRDAGYRSLAATPFIAHGTVYGALSLMSRTRLAATPTMMSLLASVGTQVGLAFAHAAEQEGLLAQERMAALGRLAAGVGHELNNPLAVIIGRVQLLERSATPDSASRHVSAIGEAAERMREILRGLTSYAKPAKAQPTLLSLSALLTATRELVAYQARTAGVAIDVDAPAGLPEVLGDRTQLTQVLVNLATNAIEAMTAGGCLTLRAAVESRKVCVRVIDTGSGIAPEHLQTVWEPFYTTKTDGTGLGLSIVRAIVEQQPGSTIDVESRVGEGTVFTLTVPVPQIRGA